MKDRPGRNLRRSLGTMVSPGVLLGLGLLTLVSCRGQDQTESGTVAVAASPFEASALLWIAQDRGFFQAGGLNVTIRTYATGAASLTGVVQGEADIVVGVTEFPVVKSVLSGDDISIIANADKGDFIYLVGRRSSGLQKPSDLKGKRVGLARGTIAEYFLGRFLELNGLKFTDVDVVDVKTAPEWVESVAEGRVDVVVTAQPDANGAKDRLGQDGFLWPIQTGQHLNGLIVTTNGWLAAHAQSAGGFLRAIGQAARYAERNPAKAQGIVQKALGLDPAYMPTVWQQNEFRLSLDQSIITAMEDETRWLMRNNMTDQKTVPNFLRFIQSDSMRLVNPEAVRISGK